MTVNFDDLTTFNGGNYRGLLGLQLKKVAILAVAAAVLASPLLPATAFATEIAISEATQINVQPNTDSNDSVSTAEVGQALQSVPGVLSSSDQISTKTDVDSAIVASVGGNTIDVPKAPEEGVTFGATNGPKLDIALPNADEAGAAKKVAPGVVAYDSGNGSANAVQANEDGSVRMLTIIDNPEAPTTYEYKVVVPNGGNVALAADGGAVVNDSQGEAITSVGAPWAKDAAGVAVTTWFTTDGASLTQHVAHNVPGVVYPVTADPVWFVVSGAVFWWAVHRCGAGGIIGAVFEYVGGSRSKRALAAAGAAGCIASFIGGWGILKNMVRVIRW